MKSLNELNFTTSTEVNLIWEIAYFLKNIQYLAGKLQKIFNYINTFLSNNSMDEEYNTVYLCNNQYG